MNYLIKEASAPTGLTDDEIAGIIGERLKREKKPGKVLLLVPDITRLNSYGGRIAAMITGLLPDAKIDVLPALGTHVPMTEEEMDRMYAGVPHEWFIAHDWRKDVVSVGTVPGAFVKEVSGGLVDFDISVEINRRLLDKSYDLIISIGQVVPHEVVGMANYNKNVFVGCGGPDIINHSHFLGAIYGMENMMGRDLTPVHRVFDYAEEHFCRDLPLLYVLTVTAPNADGPNVRSVAVGRDRAMFSASIEVSQRNNLNFLDKPLKKVVAYLDPEEFHTTWLANKAVYRTRMAIADGGELIMIAPGLHRFGEDLENDRLIRKYGYIGRDRVLKAVKENDDLANNLSVAAHLIHGSSDGRFTVSLVAEKLTREEIEGANYKYMSPADAAKYDVHSLKQGFNTVDGEEIYFVENPALGLWAHRQRFENAKPAK